MNHSTLAGSLCFGPFELIPERRQLLERGEPVRLGSRALELLIALTERAGELMSRSELESRLWPSTVVEETSLRVHVSALRKALGDGVDGARYITNVPGRGYSFVATVVRRSGASTAAEPHFVASDSVIAQPDLTHNPAAHNLPGRLARVFGRDAICEALLGALREGRLVSVVGTGGIGKTTVALRVANGSLGRYAGGVRFVDFSPLPAGSAASALLPILADALALENRTGDLRLSVQEHLRHHGTLLVLDNCEHVVQSAAELAEWLMQVAPEVRILTTSREPLEVQGEHVYRLDGLQTAEDDEDASLEQVRQTPAVQLFIERASAATAAFELRDDNLKAVCEICQHLDGMPLAIELAAARVDALGVEGVASRLGHMFMMLTRGRRTAFPRHRTLQALLDWSHDLLIEPEQQVLRRLSLFRAGFSLELAAQLCSDAALSRAVVIDALMSLVAKSLVAVDRDGQELQYRLLYTTRSYAENKLEAAGERCAWQQRHAQLLCSLLEKAQRQPAGPLSSEIAHMTEDLNQALEWTLPERRDLGLSARLVTSAFLFMQRGGVVRNLREPLETLFERLPLFPEPQPRLELRLRLAAYFVIPTPTSRHRADEAWTEKAEALAAAVGDADDRLELQYALYAAAIRRADYPSTLKHADAIRQLTVGDHEPLSVVLGDRLLVLALHHGGEHERAWALSERVLSHRVAAPIEPRFSTAIPYAVSMGGMQARIRWLTGRADDAQALCDRLMPLLPGAAPIATCQFIGFTALPLALWRGDLAAAQRLHHVMEGATARAANGYWISWVRMLGCALQALLPEGSGRDAPDENEIRGDAEQEMLHTLVPGWVNARSVERAKAGQAGWVAPELLRAAAEKLIAGGRAADGPAAAELLQRAQEFANVQGALAWELRIASSGLRLARMTGESQETAREHLAAVLARFTEGLNDADLREARRLLEPLS